MRAVSVIISASSCSECGELQAVGEGEAVNEAVRQNLVLNLWASGVQTADYRNMLRLHNGCVVFLVGGAHGHVGVEWFACRQGQEEYGGLLR